MKHQSVPTWFGWENSTASRQYINKHCPEVLEDHVYVFGLKDALQETFSHFTSPNPDMPDAEYTAARVCMDVLPKNASKWQKCRFWLRLIFVHLPARLMVVPYDLVHHDMHHSGAIYQAKRALRSKHQND